MSNQPKQKIEPLKHRVVVDANYADRSWKILEHGIINIYHQNATGLSFEELYRYVHNMVLHNFGEKLYSGLKATLTSLVEEMSRTIVASRSQDGLFLDEVNRKWVHHNKALLLIRDIFMFMDRTFIPNTDKTSVYELGLELWTNHIVFNTKIRTRHRNALMDLVHKERSGEVIDRGLMRNAIKMLMDLHVSIYKAHFELVFLGDSYEFYQGEAQRLIECCDCGDYLKKVETRLNEEIERVSHYLNAMTESCITRMVEDEMIEKHMLRLVHMENSGLVNMLLDDKYDDLGRMYKLFRRVANGLSTVCDVMTSHLKGTGKQLVTDQEKLRDPVEYVQDLLDLKDKYDKIINLAFNNAKSFQKALHSAFVYFVNLNPSSPEYISLFVDNKHRKGLKGVSEEDIELIFDKVIILFRYLQEKDVFEKYYKQHLGKRLLSGKTVSIDAERCFTLKLKTECGSQFTFNLEVMFNDMKISEDMMQVFYDVHGAELGQVATLSVQVLSAGLWPTKTSITCNIPSEVSSLRKTFEAYYLKKRTNQRLSWQTNMGTADIKTIFGNGEKHELNVSTYQMCVLMLFNNADRLTYKEIEQATQISAPELKRCLQSLACVKGKNVLRKKPMSKDVGEDDAFFVNDEFSSKLYKVRIGTVVTQKESEAERQETRQRVTNDREPQIETAVVRIMKYKRVLEHNSLIAEVTKQLKSMFIPNAVEIKKQIESLIEREFLVRDKNDRKLYRYLA